MTTISPHRPPLVRLINAAGKTARRLGLDLPDLRPEASRAAARKRTGLEDFGIDAERDAQYFEEYYSRYGVERLLPGGDET